MSFSTKADTAVPTKYTFALHLSDVFLSCFVTGENFSERYHKTIEFQALTFGITQIYTEFLFLLQIHNFNFRELRAGDEGWSSLRKVGNRVPAFVLLLSRIPQS